MSSQTGSSPDTGFWWIVMALMLSLTGAALVVDLAVLLS